MNGRRSSCTMLVAMSLIAGQAEQDTTVEVAVPQQVSALAGARISGTDAPVPILVLDGVELGKGEGITIRVFGPAEDGSKEGTLIGAAGMVGHRQKSLAEPFQKVTLTVPLNDRALKFLADRKQVKLTMKVDTPGRPALKVDRVYFRVDSRKRRAGDSKA
jgi:hypothetical protein